MRFTKEQREAYRIEQERIKNAWNRFDTFMSEQGWEKRHLFMRGNKWTRGENTIITVLRFPSTTHSLSPATLIISSA